MLLKMQHPQLATLSSAWRQLEIHIRNQNQHLKKNKQKIEAVDLLLAILAEPDSLAMKVLNNLGVDAIEIKHGIQGLEC